MRNIRSILLVALLLSVVVNAVLIIERQHDLDREDEMGSLIQENENLKDAVESSDQSKKQAERTAKNLTYKIQELEDLLDYQKDKISYRDQQIADLKSELATNDRYIVRKADGLIGAYEELLFELIYEDGGMYPNPELEALVIGNRVLAGDVVNGMKIDHVDLVKDRDLEYLNYSERISFLGNFVVAGKLQKRYMDYDEYSIIIEDATLLPHFVWNNKKFVIMMIGSKGEIDEKDYRDGDLITVKLSNLSLGYEEGKPLGNYADFINVVE